MLWPEQLFHIKKPIIAMLHPDALIASVKQAAPEAAVLCNTGCRPDTTARKLPQVRI